VNNNSYKRLLSAYLDGEIGLADKQAFEEALRSDPQLREEYQAQRRIGLTLGGGMPQVSVHPYRFRQRMALALDQRQSAFITPARAFTGAMAIALVVVSITFGLFIYQERMIGKGQFIAVGETPVQQPAVAPRPVQYAATLVVEATAESFYNRLLMESQLGMVDAELAARLLQQNGALEGATCADGQGLQAVVFGHKLPVRERVTLTLADAQRLQAVADGLTGRRSALALSSSNGELVTQQDYLWAYPAGAQLPLELIFQQ
jgi:hypothetical protein